MGGGGRAMTYGTSILPPSAGPVERALEGADAGQRPRIPGASPTWAAPPIQKDTRHGQ